MAQDKKGKNTYKFSVGAIGKKQKSGLTHAEIIICGQETVELTAGNTDALQVEFKKGETQPKNIKLLQYQEWFKMVEGLNSSPNCILANDKYTLYKEAAGGVPLDGDAVVTFGTN